MSDHLSLYVDRLITTDSILLDHPAPPLPSSATSDDTLPCSTSFSPSSASSPVQVDLKKGDGCGEEEEVDVDQLIGFLQRWESMPKLGFAECRICQDEDQIENLDTPCSCSGSLKYAHQKCVQRWCNEKGDTMCEICRQAFKGGYTSPPRPPPAEAIRIEIGGNWGITGPQLDINGNPRIISMASGHHFLDSDYDQYEAANESSAACCRSAALILMLLLLLRHALSIIAAINDEEISRTLTLLLIRAAGFLLPCYILARAMSMVQRRRQRQEETMAMLLQAAAGQAPGVRISVASGSGGLSVPHA